MLKILSQKSSFELGKNGLVTFLNPYSYQLAREHVELFQRFDTILPDGIMLVMFLRLFGIVRSKRRSFDMTSLADEVFSYSEQHQKSIYFIGSEERDIGMAVSRIAKKFPAMIIKGYRNGYFTDDRERAAVLQQIVTVTPDIVVVGMGTSLQEQFLLDLRDAGWKGTGFTCGGFFHQAAKAIDYYPHWMDVMHLRWLYRIIDEPKLFRRYAVHYPIFIWVFLCDYCNFLMERGRDSQVEATEKDIPLSLAILGTRGIPARHGGFETFAEQLSLYLVARGWSVTVYCQNNGGEKLYEDDWKGVRLIHIPVRGSDTIGSIFFDWKSTLHALREKSLVLTLGYNTAIFSFFYRMSGITNLINMDGFEWRRKKWSFFQKCWLYLNERIACKIAHHLIADHPEIQKYLETRVAASKISMIPYGVDIIENCDTSVLSKFGLQQNDFALVVARPEPENSLLEIIQAYSSKRRGYPLVIIGSHDPGNYPYHAKLSLAAGDEVLFLGAIYDKKILNSLRKMCRLYIHGHQVGGTNPSLLEAMAAGNAILAHDNPFNRQVAGNGAVYFKDQSECSTVLDHVLENAELLHALGQNALAICKENYLTEKVLSAYNVLLCTWLQRKYHI